MRHTAFASATTTAADVRARKLAAQSEVRWPVHISRGQYLETLILYIRHTSGVRSRTPKPVPPVVITTSTVPRSHQVFTVSRIFRSSSGTMTGGSLAIPFSLSISLMVGPDLSAVASCDAVSLTDDDHALSATKRVCKNMLEPVKTAARMPDIGLVCPSGAHVQAPQMNSVGSLRRCLV